MSESLKTILVIALHAEARPLIDHLGLVADSESPLPIFYREDTLLVVSGIGKVKSAIAVGYLAAKVKKEQPVLVLNLGLAGADPSTDARVGDLFLINKIVDDATNREYYPDMLVDTGIDEISLTTCDQAIDLETSTNPPKGLVDMEGSGFYEAASRFFPPHKIACLKIVSDFLKPKELTEEIATELVLKNLPSVTEYISLALKAMSKVLSPIGPDELKWIGKVAGSLRLSKTQRSLLEGWVSVYRSRGGSDLPSFASQPVDTKQEGKGRLEEIRKKLLLE
jgi:hypothetical protein